MEHRQAAVAYQLKHHHEQLSREFILVFLLSPHVNTATRIDLLRYDARSSSTVGSDSHAMTLFKEVK